MQPIKRTEGALGFLTADDQVPMLYQIQRNDATEYIGFPWFFCAKRC